MSLLVKKEYQPKKINVASLGNIVRQLHIHCIGRSEDDPLWPQGVWQHAYQVTPYSDEWVENKLLTLKRLIMQTAQHI